MQISSLVFEGGSQTFFDGVADEPWFSHDITNDTNDRFVSYDDAEAIHQKALYLRNNNN